MPRPGLDRLPARAPHTSGKRQLTVTLSDDDAEALEWLRLMDAARSWGAVVRRLIADEMDRRKVRQ